MSEDVITYSVSGDSPSIVTPRVKKLLTQLLDRHVSDIEGNWREITITLKRPIRKGQTAGPIEIVEFTKRMHYEADKA